MDDTILDRWTEEDWTSAITTLLDQYRHGDLLGMALSPLAETTLGETYRFPDEPRTVDVRGRAMQATLAWAIDALRPAGEPRWMTLAWRPYTILHGLYEQRHTVPFLAERMGIAERTFYHARRQAISLLVTLLHDECQEGARTEQRWRATIYGRYCALAPDVQSLIACIALLPGTMSLDMLRVLVDPMDVLRMQDLLQEGIAQHMVLSSADGRTVSLQPRLRSVLLPRLSPDDQQRWHYAAGVYYEQRQMMLEAAEQFAWSGFTERAARVIIDHMAAIIDQAQIDRLADLVEGFRRNGIGTPTLWAQLRLVAGAIAEFRGLLDVAIREYHGILRITQNPSIKVTALYRLAKLLILRNIDEALATYARCIEVLEGTNDTALLFQVLIDRAWIFIQERQDLSRATADLQHAERMLPPEDASGRASLYNAWAALHTRLASQASAETAASFREQALDYRFRAWIAAQESADMEHRIKIGYNLGLDYIELNHYEKAIHRLEESRQLAARTNHVPMLGLCEKGLGSCYFHQELYGLAQEHYWQAYQIFRENENRNWQAHTCYDLAEVALLLEQYPAAQEYLTEGVHLATMLGDQVVLEDLCRLADQYRNVMDVGPAHPRQWQLISFLKQHGTITNKAYRILTGMSQKQTVRDLNEFLDRGLLTKVGQGRGTHYQLTNHGAVEEHASPDQVHERDTSED